MQQRPSVPHILTQIVSLLFHPLLMSVWCVALIMTTDSTSLVYTPQVKSFVIGTVFGMCCIVPLLMWALMVFFGVNSPTAPLMRSPKSALLQLTVVISLLCCGAIFADFGLLFIIRKSVYTLAVVWFVMCIVEQLWPLSPHAMCLGAVLGIWWILLYVGNVSLLPYFIGGIVALGVLCTARIYLAPSATSAWRIVVGAIGGFAIAATLFIFI